MRVSRDMLIRIDGANSDLPRSRTVFEGAGRVTPRDQSGVGVFRRRARHKRAVVTCGDKRLHKALSFVDRVRPKHGTHRQFCDTRDAAPRLRSVPPVRAGDP